MKEVNVKRKSNEKPTSTYQQMANNKIEMNQLKLNDFLHIYLVISHMESTQQPNELA